MAKEEFPKINERLKREIEEVFEKARFQHFTDEIIEIYHKTFETLGKSGPNFLKEQKLFPFTDTVLAWSTVLREAGVGNEEIKAILLGIILATIYERGKEKR